MNGGHVEAPRAPRSLWVLAGTGLIKAFLALAGKLSPDFATSSTYAILFAAGDALFQFLPMLLAVTAAKKFKANVYTSLAIAAALLYSATIPVIADAKGVSMTLSAFDAASNLTFLGIPVVMVSYLSAVVPTILAIYAQAKLEHWLERVIPETVRNFVVPLVAVAVVVPLTFLAIGPVADLIGLDTCLAIMEVLFQGFCDSKYRPCPLLRKYVEAGWLGRKTGRGFYAY